MRRTYLWLFFSLIILLPRTFADTIHLRNGRTMEGIIEGETEDKVVLNVGFGTVTLAAFDIDHIERNTEDEQSELQAEWTYKYFDRPQYIPQRLRHLSRQFRRLQDTRFQALKSDQTRRDILEKQETSAAEKKSLSDGIKKIYLEFSAMDPQENPQQYNTLIAEYNRLKGKLEILSQESEPTEEKIASFNEDISQYTQQLTMFTHDLKGNTPQMPLTKPESEFLRRIKEEIAEMRDDFIKHMVASKKYGPHNVVNTTINGKVPAELIVDTGASVVILSQKIARKLGISYEDNEPFYATLADGSEVKAYPILLSSMEVDKVEVRNIEAAVFENDISQSSDGLLGMSFLKNFIINIDVTGNFLILEELK